MAMRIPRCRRGFLAGRESRGFTLIEVMIAMMILVGGIIVIAGAWSGNTQRLQKARMYNTTALLLQRKMTEIEIKMVGKSPDSIEKEDAGDFGAEYPQFSWEMKSQELEMPDLGPLLTAADKGADETTLMLVSKMSEYFKKAVREVRVTIIYTSKNKKQKPLRNSATIYLVNYMAELPFAALLGAAGGDDTAGKGGAGKGATGGGTGGSNGSTSTGGGT